MVKKIGEFISINAVLTLLLVPSVSAAPLDRVGEMLKDVLGRIFFDFTRASPQAFDLWIRVLIFFILFSLLYLILPFLPIFGQANQGGGRTFFPQARRMAVVVAFALAFMSAVMIPHSILVAIAGTYGWIAAILFLLGPLVGIVIALNVSNELSTATTLRDANGQERPNPHRARNALFHGLIYYLFATILHNFMQAVRTAGSSLNLSQFIEWGEFVEAIVLIAAIVYLIMALVWALGGGSNQPPGPGPQPPVPGPQPPGPGPQPPGPGPQPPGPAPQPPGPGPQPPGPGPQPIPPAQPMGPVQNFQVLPGDQEVVALWQPPLVGNVAQYQLEGRRTGILGRFRNDVNQFLPGTDRNLRVAPLQNGDEWQFRIRALGVTRAEEGPWSRWQRVRVGPRATPPQFARLLDDFDNQIQAYAQANTLFQSACTTFAPLSVAQRRSQARQRQVLQSMTNLLARMQAINITYTLIQQQFLQFSPADRARFAVLQGNARAESAQLVQFLTPQILNNVGGYCPFIVNIVPPQFP